MYPVFNPSVTASFGGAEVQLFLLANAIKSLRPELSVHFLVADYGQSSSWTSESGITLHRSINFSASLLQQLITFCRAMVRVEHETVVQRAISPFTPVIFALTKLLGGRFVYMVACDAEVDGTHSVLRGAVTQRLFKWTLKYSDVVIAQNTFQYEQIVARIGRKPITLRNGFILTPYKPNVDRTKVLWVGRNDWQKRPELMIDIMRELQWIDFVMVCNPAMDDRSASFMAVREAASALSNCTFIELLDFAAMNELYADTRVLVNTSVSEGFPNTYIQAAMQSVPIVSLEANPDDILHRYAMGYCTYGDIEALKQRLVEFCANDDLTTTMGRNGHEYVAKNHDITKQAQQFISLLFPELAGSKDV